MKTFKSYAWWTIKKLAVVACVAAIALAVQVGFHENVSKLEIWHANHALEERIHDFAKKDYWDDSKPEIPARLLTWGYGDKVPAERLDWSAYEKSYHAEQLIPANAMDWDDAEIPVKALDWPSAAASTAREVRIVELDGDDEVLVVRRGTNWSAYKVKQSNLRHGFTASR